MEKDDFRGSDIVTPLVELPSVLCDVVEILEGAVRVVRGQGGQWSEVREEGENIGPQVRGTLHCAVTNIAADGIMSTVNTITTHTSHHTMFRASGPDNLYHGPMPGHYSPLQARAPSLDVVFCSEALWCLYAKDPKIHLSAEIFLDNFWWRQLV